MTNVYLIQYQLVGDNFNGEVQNFNLVFTNKDSAETMAYKLTIDNTLLEQMICLLDNDNSNNVYSIRAWVEELSLVD